MKKISMYLLIILTIIPSFYIKAQETEGTIKLAESAKSAIMLEASTGEIIFEKNSHEKLAPASMTKVMSMLLIMESLDKEIIHWDEIVTVSENASKMGGSQILLETNEKMSVSDLLKGVAVASGNDAVVALAEKISGTESAFVDMMNKRAKELGLKDTNFKNPHGLDEANHYTSAYDMAIMAKELVKHEKILEFTSIYEDYLRKGTKKEIWLVNTNKLVRFYDGVDGLKTGFTESAGYCLTATAKKNNMRIITVVMGEPDSKTRNADISSMLDYAFAQYEIETLLSKNSIVKKVDVAKGKKEQVEIVPETDINILNKKTEEKKNVTYDIKINNINAPIKQGDVVGTITVNDKSKRVINLTVKEDIEKANYFDLYFKNLKDIFSGNIKIIK